MSFLAIRVEVVKGMVIALEEHIEILGGILNALHHVFSVLDLPLLDPLAKLANGCNKTKRVRREGSPFIFVRKEEKCPLILPSGYSRA